MIENCENPEEVFHDVVLKVSEDEDADVGDYGQEFPEYSTQYVRRRGLFKYSATLKQLLPFRRKQKNKNHIQVDSAGFFSFITFSWLSRYVYQAYRKGLTIEDIPVCSPYESGDLNSQRLSFFWKAEIDKRGPENASFGRAAWKFLQTRIIICSFLFILSCIMGFMSSALFMRKLIQYAEDPDAEVTSGLSSAFAFTLSELTRIMLLALYNSMSYRTAIRLKSACLVLVYKKIIHLQTLGTKSLGEVINMFGSDGGRLFYMVVFGPTVIGGPVVVVCCAVYIYYTLGSWPLLGLTTFLLFYPLQYVLSRLTGYFRERTIRKTDDRIRLVTEVLSTIKLIKMYAWDPCFMKRLQAVRNEELSLLQKGLYCQSMGISLAPTVPVISGILIFIIQVLSGGNLTAAQAYPLATLLYSQLRGSLLNLRIGSENIIDGFITFGRIKNFVKDHQRSKRKARCNILLNLTRKVDSKNVFEEMLVMEDVSCQVTCPTDKTVALSVNEGCFKWVGGSEPTYKEKEGKTTAIIEMEELNGKKEIHEPFILDSINLHIMKGSLIGICGTVGSGKSSLLQACLGQMKLVSGQVQRSGRCAYVSQEAWIENATFKENVLFGEPFDSKKYNDTLYSCALNADVNALPAGDETEIGERGINLSGGQKQRLSLARAIYSNRDIYFLDDPLSAVDSQVAAHIFEKCILNVLGKKTVLLVTHQTRFLKKCDEILVMKGGKIVERGTHHELLSKEREYSLMVESSTLFSLQRAQGEAEGKRRAGKESEGSTETETLVQKTSTSGKKFNTTEEQIRGEVKSAAYSSYVKFAGGYFMCFIVFMSIFINVGSNSFSSWWLAIWLKAGSGNTTVIDPVTNETVISTNIGDNPDLYYYIQMYCVIIGVICCTSLLRGITFTQVTIRASRMLHNSFLVNLMSSRLRHFEETPIGRIQNIFSRDFDEIDSRLPSTMESLIQNIWVVSFAFLFITTVFPWFIVALVILSVLYYIIGKVFRVAIRDLKRIEAISKAPILSAISATVNGLPTIHAFGKEGYYLADFYKKYDGNSVCSFMTNCAMRWMALRLDLISVVVVLITSLLVVFLKSEVAPALAGLALSYSAHISGIFQFTLRLMTDAEGKFIAVERILLFTRKFETEGNEKEAIDPSPKWPSRGSIKFENVQLSYSRNLPPVLNGVTFAIEAGEKIGIVGRTGAGKSSLVAAIFRLVELDHGAIFIDGVDISSVRLPELRSRISVIPQDPVFFSGTLRFNLDPSGKYGDNVIWEALKQTKLYSKINAMPNGLSTLLGEGGDILSAGESQLLCLARALLRGTKILILDEATSSVDPDTESAVQSTIEDNFSHCTILTIAHRLKTVNNCGKVLVMNKGKVEEFGDPKLLVKNPNSLFSKMISVLK